MFIAPTGYSAKLLAATLLIAVLCLVLFGGFLPLWQLYVSQNDEIGDLRLGIEQETLYIAATSRMHTEFPSRTSPMLLAGTDAVASAELQDELQAIARRANAQFSSVETLPAEDLGDYRKVGIRAAMTENSDIIIQVLRLLDSDRLTLLIDGVDIAVQPTLPHANSFPLNAYFSIYGFVASPQRSVQQ